MRLNASSIWYEVWHHRSKTFLFVRSHVNYKPAFSKSSTQGTVIENLRLASTPGHNYCWWKWYSHRQNWEERFLNISSLVCIVQAMQSYPVMIALFVEKKKDCNLSSFLVFRSLYYSASGISIRHSVHTESFPLVKCSTVVRTLSLLSSNSDFRSFVM